MIIIVIRSVVDADPDSIYHPDADPDADSDFLFDADPVADPNFQPDADPDPSFRKRLKPLKM